MYFLKNTRLEQINKMKYLGIIIDNILKLSEHISNAAENCTKRSHSSFKSAKLSWRLKNQALKKIHGAVLPILLYAAPPWIEAMKCDTTNQNLLLYML